jgi:glycosyltransferase involved in cell wall biosynthesis
MRRAISPVEDFSAYIALRRLMKAERPAVVHTHASKAGFLGRAAARALGIPVVHTPHVMPMEWSGSALYLALERRAAKWTDRLVVLNDRQETLARDKLELPSDRIRYLVNGVDVDAFYPATPVVFARARRKLEVREMRPLVGIAARLEPQKGVGTFIGAAAQVLEEQPRAIFLIAGSGSLQPELERRCAKLGIEKSVRFLGEQALMPSFYHALDVFALASLWEGMPYAILEAQASGLAVVATSTPGAQALIRPGETGSLVRLDDPTSMASAICTYLADQRLRDRVGRRAREAVVAHHSVQQWAERLAGLYRELVPDGSGT